MAERAPLVSVTGREEATTGQRTKKKAVTSMGKACQPAFSGVLR